MERRINVGSPKPPDNAPLEERVAWFKKLERKRQTHKSHKEFEVWWASWLRSNGFAPPPPDRDRLALIADPHRHPCKGVAARDARRMAGERAEAREERWQRQADALRRM